jgi:hypothetical protein
VFFAACLFISCGNDAKEKTTTTSKEVEKPTETPKVNNTYFAWVDKINLRASATTNGKVIATYTPKDSLEFTGTKSDAKEIIVLRGVAYNDYWMKVTTKDAKEGWVYGGAVTQTGNKKGNGIITDTQFDFEHFGKFDVSSWTDLGITRTESGDSETVGYSYFKDNQIVEIDRTEVGEYGYYKTYRLMDGKRNLLKERKFGFTVEMGDSSPKMELTETVKDFTTKKEYSRKQNLNKHFMQLNARPQMVNGTWTETVLKEEEKTPSAK